MTMEEKLKALILRRYVSVREFAIDINMPYSTLMSIFKRGVVNSSVSNVITICKALRISADALADGEIISSEPRIAKPINDRIEVKELVKDTKDLLTHGGRVTLDGEPISKQGLESLIDSMDVGVELARRRK